MYRQSLGLLAALSAGILGLSATLAIAANQQPQLAKFTGCWMTAKAYGVMVTTDAFKADGFTLSEEYSALTIEPIGEEAFTNVVKGTLDIWSEKSNYYIPTIYYGGVYDPIRDAILTDSTLYVVGKKLYFVHNRTTTKSSDRAFRVLDRVDCKEINAKRDAAHKAYKPFGG